jgi:type III pantothenate kinase
MLLADIGNTHFHLFDGKNIEHLPHQEAIERYQHHCVYYICVSPKVTDQLASIHKWKNIANMLHLNGAYDTLGVDRKALSLSRKSGIFIDAGSAITLDVVEEGIYQGGCILLGLQASLNAYRAISSKLATSLNSDITLDQLPITTKDGISYGIIAPIKALIEKLHKNHPLYFTGGDGKLLAQHFEGAIYDETLVFQGMQKAIKESKRC